MKPEIRAGKPGSEPNWAAESQSMLITCGG